MLETPSHPTFEMLRGAVGQEKAHEVVRSVGVAVLHAAQGNVPGSLDSIVTNLVGRLTQQEIASLARGDSGVVNRITAMAEDQVKALQSTQPATNKIASGTATTSGMGGLGQWINGVWVSGSRSGSGLSERGGNQFAELRAKDGAIGDTSTGPKSGYSWLSPANQNIPGFSKAQVASAANFLKGAGLNRDEVNEDTQHMVHLSRHRKDIGDFIKRKKEIEKRKARGEDVSEDEAKLEQDKAAARGRMTPTEREHFDRFKAIQSSNVDRALQRGADADRELGDKASGVNSEEKPQDGRLLSHDQDQKARDKTKSHAQAVAEADDVFGSAPAAPSEKKPKEEKAPRQTKPEGPARPVQQASNTKARAPTLTA